MGSPTELFASTCSCTPKITLPHALPFFLPGICLSTCPLP